MICLEFNSDTQLRSLSEDEMRKNLCPRPLSEIEIFNGLQRVRQLVLIEGTYYVRVPFERRNPSGRPLGFKAQGRGATVEEAVNDFRQEMIVAGQDPNSFDIVEDGKLLVIKGTYYWVPMNWPVPEEYLYDEMPTLLYNLRMAQAAVIIAQARSLGLPPFPVGDTGGEEA